MKIKATIGILAVCLLSSCCETLIVPGQDDSLRTHITIKLKNNLSSPQTKSSSDPDEDRLTDVNLLVFNDCGVPEHIRYIKGNDIPGSGLELSLDLLAGKSYTFLACANTGYRISGDSLEKIMEMRHYTAYPDEFRNGMLMSAVLEDFTPLEDSVVELELKRAMSRISVRMDRSRLDRNVDISIKSIRVYGCPKSVRIFSDSRAESNSDLFGTGFYKSGLEASPLNVMHGDGTSDSVCLYCFENKQGKEDAELGTYIQIEADYLSDRHRTLNGSSLYYRFFIGSDDGSFNAERNTSYEITVIPEGTGISGDSWRVDRKGLTDVYGESWFKFHPSNYIECMRGDTLHLWCEYGPPEARCVIDPEYLEEDRNRGIYDYEIDGNGKGVTLYIKGKGTGIVLFDVEDPVNDGAMCVIVSEP